MTGSNADGRYKFPENCHGTNITGKKEGTSLRYPPRLTPYSSPHTQTFLVQRCVSYCFTRQPHLPRMHGRHISHTSQCTLFSALKLLPSLHYSPSRDADCLQVTWISRHWTEDAVMTGHWYPQDRLSHGFIAPRPLYTGPLCPTLE
jgi:hypothetical protein